jgi:hypothetical protein
MKTLGRKSLLNVRPHPGPLPQEREKRSAVAGEAGLYQLFVRRSINSTDAAKARRSSKFYETVHCCPLSPGERVRVRASVNAFSAHRTMASVSTN